MVAVSVLGALSLSLVGFSALLSPLPPASPDAAATTTTPAASPFSAVGVIAHSTGYYAPEEFDVCPATLDIAAPPRATPKQKAKDGAVDKDPLGLWAPPSGPGGPRGPSVFKLNQGYAIDVLRNDYPQLFVRKPDLSIFTQDVELHDPSGKRLSGRKQYERVFDALRFLRRTTMQDAEVTYRLVVVEEKIRVRWTAKLWMRDPALGLTSLPGSNGEPALVHIDGVSSYVLNDEGKIRAHHLENIVMRGQDETVAKLGLMWPSPAMATPELAIPFFRSLDAALPAGFFSAATAGGAAARPRCGRRGPAARAARRRRGLPWIRRRRRWSARRASARRTRRRRGGSPSCGARADSRRRSSRSAAFSASACRSSARRRTTARRPRSAATSSSGRSAAPRGCSSRRATPRRRSSGRRSRSRWSVTMATRAAPATSPRATPAATFKISARSCASV